MFAAIIRGLVKNALLPVYDKDRRRLRDYCTKPGCGMGVKVKKKQKQPDGSKIEVEVLKPPYMTAAEFGNKPASFVHKYCRHTTPAPEEQERRLRDIPSLFAHLRDPSSPGQLLFREGGPVLKALEQLILLVRAGKLQGGHQPCPCVYMMTLAGPFAASSDSVNRYMLGSVCSNCWQCMSLLGAAPIRQAYSNPAIELAHITGLLLQTLCRWNRCTTTTLQRCLAS